MPELAKAYVQIIPSAEGIKGKLKSVMDGEADSSGKSAGETFGTTFGDVVKAGLKTAGAGIAAAAGVVGAAAKSAIEGYADYQQLTGGIETLFGDNAQTVANAAATAFKTAGMSVNDYMETTIQSSAAMIKSLDGDTARAAELMDMSITDMADNVNKMGTSMEAIQDAYRGFSRNNFTMLDNLALGYAGTNQGMYELMLRAAELDETFANSADFYLTEKGTLVAGYADMVSAIHIVQTEMGITDTTKKEAIETITGSFGALKAAWANLLVGMADSEANLSGLIGDVVDSAETAFRNLLPVAEQALSGIGAFVEQIAPIVAEKLPGLTETVLPSILSAGTSLLAAVITALPSLLGVLIEQLPTMLDELLNTVLGMLNLESLSNTFDVFKSVLSGVIENLQPLIDLFKNYIENGNLAEDATTVLNTIIGALSIAISGMSILIGEAVDKITSFVELMQEGTLGAEALKSVIISITAAIGAYKAITIAAEAAQKIVTAAQWLWNAALNANPIGIVVVAVGALVGAIITLWTTNEEFRNFFIEAWGNIKEFFVKTWESIAKFFQEDIPNTFNNVVDFFKELPEKALTWGKDLISNFIDGIKEKWDNLKTTVSNVASGIKSFLGFSEPEEGPLSDFHTYAPDMMALFAKGIQDNEHLITDQLGKSFDLSDTLKSGFSSDAEFLRIAEYNPERAKTTGGGFGAAGTPTVDELAEAILRALEGAGIYLDGDAVGRIISRAQARAARVNG